MTRLALVGGLGPDWVAVELAAVDPAPTEVLVDVRAAGINRADLFALDGSYHTAAQDGPSWVAGLEMAGEIVTIGDQVQGWSPGDRVMAPVRGAFATAVTVDYRALMPIPDSASFTEAAALPVAAMTAHDALRQAQFIDGQSVLILGGSSSAGLFAIALSRALCAATVLATTRSPDKADALLKAGADQIVISSVEDVATAVLKATDGQGIDVVLDHVGGQLLAQVLPATKPLGTIVNIGRLSGPHATLDLDVLALRRLRLIGTTFSIRTPIETLQVCAEVREQVLPHVRPEAVWPKVNRVFGIHQAGQARDFVASNVGAGKTILDFQQ